MCPEINEIEKKKKREKGQCCLDYISEFFQNYEKIYDLRLLGKAEEKNNDINSGYGEI